MKNCVVLNSYKHDFCEKMIYEYMINGDMYKFVIDMNLTDSLDLCDMPVYALNVDKWELIDIVPGVDIHDGVASFMELYCTEVA